MFNLNDGSLEKIIARKIYFQASTIVILPNGQILPGGVADKKNGIFGKWKLLLLNSDELQHPSNAIKKIQDYFQYCQQRVDFIAEQLSRVAYSRFSDFKAFGNESLISTCLSDFSAALKFTAKQKQELSKLLQEFHAVPSHKPSEIKAGFERLKQFISSNLMVDILKLEAQGIYKQCIKKNLPKVDLSLKEKIIAELFRIEANSYLKSYLYNFFLDPLSDMVFYASAEDLANAYLYSKKPGAARITFGSANAEYSRIAIAFGSSLLDITCPIHALPGNVGQKIAGIAGNANCLIGKTLVEEMVDYFTSSAKGYSFFSAIKQSIAAQASVLARPHPFLSIAKKALAGNKLTHAEKTTWSNICAAIESYAWPTGTRPQTINDKLITKIVEEFNSVLNSLYEQAAAYPPESLSIEIYGKLSTLFLTYGKLAELAFAKIKFIDFFQRMRQAVEDSIPKIQIAQESQPFYKDDSSAFRYSQIALPLLFLPAQPLDKHSAYELPLSLIHTLGNGTAAEARVSNKIEIEFQQKEKPSAIKLPQNLRTSIDGHLMLGAVLLHLASQSVTWFKHRWWQTPIKKTSPDLLVGAPLLHEKLFNCRQRLLALECQLEEIQFNHLVPDEESRWLIEDTLQPLQAKLLKFKLDATTTQLIDFELDIEALENAIKEIHDAHHEKLLQQSMASARQKVNFFSSQSAVKADVNYAMLAGGLQLQP